MTDDGSDEVAIRRRIAKEDVREHCTGIYDRHTPKASWGVLRECYYVQFEVEKRVIKSFLTYCDFRAQLRFLPTGKNWGELILPIYQYIEWNVGKNDSFSDVVLLFTD